MKGDQKDGKEKAGTEKGRGTILRRRMKWGVESINRQCLALALSLMFGTFGALRDADSWERNEEGLMH